MRRHQGRHVRRHRDHHDRRHRDLPDGPASAASCPGSGAAAFRPATAGGRLPVRRRHHADPVPAGSHPAALPAHRQERPDRQDHPAGGRAPDVPAARRRRRRTGCCQPGARGGRASATAAWAARPRHPGCSGCRHPAAVPLPRASPAQGPAAPRAGEPASAPRSPPSPLPAPAWPVREQARADPAVRPASALPARTEPAPVLAPVSRPPAGPAVPLASASPGRGSGRACARHPPTSTNRRLPWGMRPATCGRPAPPRWRTPTSRTHPDLSTWREHPCWLRRAPSRARVLGPCLPLLSSSE